MSLAEQALWWFCCGIVCAPFAAILWAMCVRASR
jgi:hypothetical protein